MDLSMIEKMIHSTTSLETQCCNPNTLSLRNSFPHFGKRFYSQISAYFIGYWYSGLQISKYLVPILSPLTVNDYAVKDSSSFAKEVVYFDHSLFKANLDVESLFINIPIDETIKKCSWQFVFQQYVSKETIKSELYYILKLGKSESSFIFDILYKQIDGVSMGLPLGPILANAITKNFGVVIVHQNLNLLKFKDHSFSFARYKQKKL